MIVLLAIAATICYLIINLYFFCDVIDALCHITIWLGVRFGWFVKGRGGRLLSDTPLDQIHMNRVERTMGVHDKTVAGKAAVVRWLTIPYLVLLVPAVVFDLMGHHWFGLGIHLMWAFILWSDFKKRPKRKKRASKVLARVKEGVGRLVVVPVPAHAGASRVAHTSRVQRVA